MDFTLDDDRLWWYRAKVNNVVDGDTLDLLVDRGMHEFALIRVRLNNVDTPEIFGVNKESEEYQEGIRAKKYVEEEYDGQEVLIRTEKQGSFGRWLATIHEPGRDRSLNEELLEKGLAVEA